VVELFGVGDDFGVEPFAFAGVLLEAGFDGEADHVGAENEDGDLGVEEAKVQGIAGEVVLEEKFGIEDYGAVIVGEEMEEGMKVADGFEAAEGEDVIDGFDGVVAGHEKIVGGELVEQGVEGGEEHQIGAEVEGEVVMVAGGLAVGGEDLVGSIPTVIHAHHSGRDVDDVGFDVGELGFAEGHGGLKKVSARAIGAEEGVFFDVVDGVPEVEEDVGLVLFEKLELGGDAMLPLSGEAAED